MAQTQHTRTKKRSRGVLARPLDALVFLLPLIIFYEVASLQRENRVIAFDLLKKSFELFGHAGVWMPGIVVVVILLATHAASREPWTIHWRRVAWMYAEALLFAVPLLALNRSLSMTAGSFEEAGTYHQLAMGIGAGIYEELVFRLILISLIVMLGVDLLRIESPLVTFLAIAFSSLAFAAHHHQPIGLEPFDAVSFVFRTVAGVYLAAIFWYRGYGPAAGCHAAYNVALSLLALVSAP
jgi:hypothetical protein